MDLEATCILEDTNTLLATKQIQVAWMLGCVCGKIFHLYYGVPALEPEQCPCYDNFENVSCFVG